MKYCTVCNAKYEDNVSFCPLDGEVLEDDPTSLVNNTLDGQYHIEDLLGKGGMGAVYRARHILLGDRVAIKVLPPQMRSNAEWLRRFRREGQAARRFRHPNAVTVYDLRTTNEGLIYMVMEYVEGHTLDAELKKRGRFSPLEALNVLEPVMSVLNAAHAMGVVHRDLKPENIMIGSPGESNRVTVKLLDLGIAKMREVAGSEASGTTALTVAGQILGTPYYMSPEQWGEVPRDANSEIDGRADIYSLGTVFYELIAGRKPFNGKSLQELRREHVAVMPQPLHELLPDVPESFSRAVARAMAKDRGDRQATAGELDAELRNALGLPPADISASTFATTGSYTTNSATTSQPGTDAHTGSKTAGPNTRDIPDARHTQSDIGAATVLTLEQQAEKGTMPLPSSATAPQMPASSVAARPPEPHTPPAQSSAATGGTSKADVPAPTIATHSPAFSTASQAQTPPAPPIINAPPAFSAAPAVAKPGRSLAPLIIVAALVLFLVIAGGGAWFIWSRMQDSSGSVKAGGGETKTGETVPGNKGLSAASGSTGESANAPETLRYWLELESPNGSGQTERAAGEVMSLRSKQAFKFHFTPRQDGYLYVIGPGEKNVPTTFLTTKPLTEYARTNQVKAGTDFAFPDGPGKWIELDQTTGTDNFTVIFSPTTLSAPAFLNSAAGHALNASEQQEFQDFRAQYKANSPTASVISQGSPESFVSVKMAGQATAVGPLIFDVRIEHK